MLSKILFRASILLFIIGMIFILPVKIYTVSAHEGVELGGYEVEFGWLTEPPLAGQLNAAVFNFSKDGNPLETALDVSGLKVEVSYGGQNKTLALQPLNEESTGEFIAPFIPTLPGVYTLSISGTLDGEAVSTQAEPEEVLPAADAQFPTVNTGQEAPGLSWVEITSLGLGAAGVILAGLALARRPGK